MKNGSRVKLWEPFFVEYRKRFLVGACLGRHFCYKKNLFSQNCPPALLDRGCISRRSYPHAKFAKFAKKFRRAGNVSSRV